MSLPEDRRKIVFLDRDGVINRDSPDYIKSWAEFEYLPRSLAAFRLLNDHGFETIVITNQSGIGRKFLTLETLTDMHRRMKDQIRENGGDLLDIYFCPHMPDKGCDCRKPKSGMIREACRVHQIEPDQTVMVGDSTKDIECAHNAGCGTAVLVKTGNGTKAESELRQNNTRMDYVAEDLYDAVEWIVGSKVPKVS